MTIASQFEPYLAYLTKSGRSPKTYSEHKRILDKVVGPAIGSIEIEELTPLDVNNLSEWGAKAGRYGHQRGVVVLRSVMRYLKLAGYRMRFDTHDVRLPHIPRLQTDYLTPDELEQLRNTFKGENLQSLRTRALIEVLLDTGLRIAEVCALNKNDIDFAKREAKVVNCKTHEVNIVYFTPRSLEWLQRYWDERKDSEEAAFVSGRGRMLEVTSRNYLRVHSKELGIRKHIKHHIFRKTMVTYLLQNNVDIKTVQVLARHRSPTTTLNYYAGVCAERASSLHQQVMGGV